MFGGLLIVNTHKINKPNPLSPIASASRFRVRADAGLRILVS
jgi:hypothetical protein